MKKKKSVKVPVRRGRGRPRKKAIDSMVPLGASIPARMRDSIDALGDKHGHRSRSETIVKLLEAGIKVIEWSPKRLRSSR